MVGRRLRKRIFSELSVRRVFSFACNLREEHDDPDPGVVETQPGAVLRAGRALEECVQWERRCAAQQVGWKSGNLS